MELDEISKQQQEAKDAAGKVKFIKAFCKLNIQRILVGFEKHHSNPADETRADPTGANEFGS